MVVKKHKTVTITSQLTLEFRKIVKNMSTIAKYDKIVTNIRKIWNFSNNVANYITNLCLRSEET